MENYSFRADGEANVYTVFKDDNWLMSIRHNGEPGVAVQEANLRIVTNSFNLVKAVEEMRELQKEFFNPNKKKADTPGKARAKEIEVDKLLKQIKAGSTQPGLF